MRIKKSLLLAGAALAAVAFMAPAVVQADEWYTTASPNDVTLGVGKANGEEVTFKGKMSKTVVGLTLGSCDVHVLAKLWNENEEEGVKATGEIIGYTGTGRCKVKAGGVELPGCEIEESTSAGFPWHITVSGTSISIAGMNVTMKFTPGCAMFGIPGEVTVSGTGTGEFENEGEEEEGTKKGCIKFNNSGDLTIPGVPGSATNIDGKFCANDLTLY